MERSNPMGKRIMDGYGTEAGKRKKTEARKIELKSDEKSGLIKIIVPPNIESGKVKVYYSQPKRYVIANIISVITAVALVMLGARNRKSRWNGEM